MSELVIMGQVDHIDLRKITAQGRFLYRMMKRYRLKHLQCVCFTNKAQTRFRLIVNINGMPFLDLPPIDEQSKHSLYLKVSEWLAVRARLKDTRVKLEKFGDRAKRRIELAKKRKRKKK